MAKRIPPIFIFGLFAAYATPLSAVSLADALDGLSKVAFGRESTLVIGDTVDVMDSSKPLDRCMNFDVSDGIVRDTSGAISSRLSFRLVRDIDQFENTFNFSYNIEASSSANFGGIIGGESTLNNFGKFESFLKKDSEAMILILEAYAEHGRDIIQEFDLKPQFQALLDKNDYKGFRARCGTHFIRGWNRRSSVSVIIEIKNISKNAKFIIENNMTGSFGANIGIDELSAKGTTKISNNLSNTLKLASKLGAINARVEAVGGQGIATLAKINNIVAAGDIMDAAKINDLLENLISAAGDFTYENSSPETFLLVQHAGLDANNVDFNAVNFEKLGKIYRTLIRVDQRLQLYENYKIRDFDLWSNYFRVATDELKALRTNLIKTYTACRNQGDCEATIPDKIDGVILDDVIDNARFEARCIHSYHHDDVLNDQIVESYDYLSSIVLVLNSDIRFLKSLDLLSTEVKAITPELDVVKVRYDPQRQQSVRISESGDNGDIFADIYREHVDRNEVTIDGNLSIDAIRTIRKRVGQSIFVLTFQTSSGLLIEQVLGRPDMRGCPAYLPS